MYGNIGSLRPLYFDCTVQAGSAITWNKGVHLSRGQFCSDLPEILSVFSSPCNEETVPRIKYESNF